jgi:nucleoside-diphosphate-sugar epimerase
MARVLVTGASGFVGRQAVPILVARGHEVIAVGRPDAEMAPPEGVRFAICDLLREGSAAELIATCRPSHLLHLAWNVTPGRFWTDPDNLDWVSTSLRLFRAFAEQGGQRFVGIGSCAEYDWSHDFLRENETPLKPQTLYATAKVAFSSLIQHVAPQLGVSVGWGRVFFLYGPGEKRGRLVSDVFLSLLEGQPALVSHGRQQRDFMHVEDVAGAFVALLESPVTGGVNIATGDCRPLADIVSAIAEQTGRPDLLRLGALPARPDDPPRLAADVRRLRQEVGFQPRFDLAAGIADTHRWWLAQQVATT